MDAEVAAALIGAGVGVGTIGGALVGAVVGARIQARGGHDQAAAAREAPAIEAREARAETLRMTRQAAWTRFMAASRQCLSAAEQLYETDDGTAAQKRHEFEDALAEAQLVGPPGMLEKVRAVMDSVGAAYDLSVVKGASRRAWMVLDAAAELEAEQNIPQPGVAHSARVALTMLSTVTRAGQLGTQTDTDYYTRHDAAEQALRLVPALDREQGWALIGDAIDPERDEALDKRRRAVHEYEEARRAFIEKAQIYLGTEAEPL